jgi:fumarate reductase subunit C
MEHIKTHLNPDNKNFGIPRYVIYELNCVQLPLSFNTEVRLIGDTDESFKLFTDIEAYPVLVADIIVALKNAGKSSYTWWEEEYRASPNSIIMINYMWAMRYLTEEVEIFEMSDESSYHDCENCESCTGNREYLENPIVVEET